MDDDRVNRLLFLFSDRLPQESLAFVRERLKECDDELHIKYVLSQLKDPEMALVLSILLGWLGVDRLFIGSIGIGVGKLLTCGGALVWWVVDCFMIMDATRRKNLETMLMAL